VRRVLSQLLLRLLVVTTAALGLSVMSQSEVRADTRCQVTDRETGICLVYVRIPGTPETPGTDGTDGPEDTGEGESCYWDGTSQGITDPPPGPVPCSSDAGYWSNPYNCYIKLLEPQPPATDPSWQGHDPAEGAVYQCYQPQTGVLVWVWYANPPPNSGVGPTPGEVAQLAIDQMRLRAPQIGIVPEPGPDRVGLVGMPVWLWVADPGPETIGPKTATASAGGITVTATAELFEITWDLGDGTTITCDGPGTPYKPSYGDEDSPDCGHRYERTSADEPDQKYTVTATSDWVVTWTGAGQSGTIRLDGLTQSTQITVGELQVLVY
jgi:hypothetical protein